MTLDLHALRRERGGSVYDGGRRWIGPGPGHSRHDASLSVRLEHDGRALVYSFAGDPFVACAAYLGLSRDQAQRPDRATARKFRADREAQTRDRRNTAWTFCEEVWAGTLDADDSPVERYLTGRGLPWPYPADLRFHPAAPLDYERRRVMPAMVASCDRRTARPRGSTSQRLPQTARGRRG